MSEGVGISSILWAYCLRLIYSKQYESLHISKVRNRISNLSVSPMMWDSRRLTTFFHSRMNLVMSESQVVMYDVILSYCSYKYLVVCLFLTIPFFITPLKTNSPYTIPQILKSSYMAWIYDQVPLDTYVRMQVTSISKFCYARLLSTSTYNLMCMVSSLTVNFPYSQNISLVLAPTLISVIDMVPDPHLYLSIILVRLVVISRTFPVVWSN